MFSNTFIVAEIVSELLQQRKLFYFNFRRGYAWNETTK